MTSIWADMLSAIYSGPIAADATLTPGSGGSALSVKIIDKTRGLVFSEENADVQTILPAATMRMATLEDNALDRNDLDGGSLTINGKVWTIKAHSLKPNPDGELKGEVVLLLSDEAI